MHRELTNATTSTEALLHNCNSKAQTSSPKRKKWIFGFFSGLGIYLARAMVFLSKRLALTPQVGNPPHPPSQKTDFDTALKNFEVQTALGSLMVHRVSHIRIFYPVMLHPSSAPEPGDSLEAAHVLHFRKKGGQKKRGRPTWVGGKKQR